MGEQRILSSGSCSSRWSEELDPDSKPPISAFSVNASTGEAVSVSGIRVNAGGMDLHLSSTFGTNAHFQLSYVPPTEMGSTPIRDLAGNIAAGFSDRTLGNTNLSPDKPTGLTVTPGPGSLTLTWNAVNRADGYRVQWKSGSETYIYTGERHANVSGGNHTSYTIRSLTPRTTYSVEVNALRTYAAESIPSDNLTGTPLDAAVSRVALTSDPGSDGTYVEGDVIRATVTFNGPVDIAGGTPQLELDVGGSPEDAECTSGTAVTQMVCSYPVAANDVDPNGISIGANKLALNGATIRLAGTGHNAVPGHAAVPADAGHKVDTAHPTFESAETSNTGATLVLTFSETLRTTTALPDAFPVTVGVVSRGVDSVAVNGAKLTLTLASAVANGDTVTVDYTDPSADDDGRAVQDLAGNDAASFTGRTVTNNVPAIAVAVPAAPAGLRATAKGPRVIELEWAEPADNGNAITGYRIEVSSGVGWTDLEPNTGSTETRYRHEGLHPGRDYDYRVSALNVEGTGPASSRSRAQTWGGAWISQAPSSIAEGDEIVFTVKLAQSYAFVNVHVSDSGGVMDRVGLPWAYEFRRTIEVRKLDTYRLFVPRAFPRGNGEGKVRVRTRANGALGEGGSVTLTISPDRDQPPKARGDRIEPYTATVTVRDNEPAGLFVEDAEANEADGTMDFRVRLQWPYQGTVTVDYATADVTATAGADYTGTDTGTSNTLTFAANETVKTVSVPLLADSVADDGERFRLVLSNPSAGVKINDGEAFGTIRDSSSAAAGPLTGLVLVDGATGTGLGTISNEATLTLPAPQGSYRLAAATSAGASIGSVRFSLSGPKAASVTDDEAPYELFPGPGQTLPAGTYTLSATAYPKDDAEGEALQTFDVSFSVPASVVPAGTALSGLSLTSRSGGSPQAIEEDGSSVFTRDAGERFEIAAGVADESVIGSVRLELSGASTAARTDNDAPYELFAGSGSAIPSGIYTVRAIVHGNADGGGSVLQTLTRTFTLGMLTAEFEKVPGEHVGKAFRFRVRFNEAATASDADLEEALSVTGGTVSWVRRLDGRADLREVLVQPADDLTDVTLSLPATTDCAVDGAVCMADGRMLSNASEETVAAAVQVSVSDAAGTEGGNAVFTVSLNQASDAEVTVDYATQDLSKTTDRVAKAGSDYTAVDSTLTFAVGDTSKTVSVALTADAVNDDGEEFQLVLSNPSGAWLEPVRGELLGYDDAAVGRGTIRESNGATSKLSVHDDGATEGRDGALRFPVVLSPASTGEVTVGYATSDDSAVAGEDYDETSGTLTFAMGNTLMFVEVPIIDDPVPDSGETLTLTLSSPSTGATLDPDHTTATGTIFNSEATVLSVADAEAAEADGALAFEVTLNQAEESEVTVDYATADGTATDGEDYTGTSGTLIFAAGETSQTVPVPVATDEAEEGDETLTLVLTNPSGAGIAAAAATGTILDGAGRAGEGTAVASAGPLTGFTLVDAGMRKDVGTIADGGAFALVDPANGSFGIRVETADGAEIGRVELELSGAKAVTQTEKYAPYSLYGDAHGAVHGADLPEGAYTLRAAAYAERRPGGEELGVLEVSFQVVASGPMTGFTLVDAAAGTDVGTIADGATFALADPANGSYGVRVETAANAAIGRVELELSGAKAVTQTEYLAPYSLHGDAHGAVHGADLPVGAYTLRATAYAAGNVGGAELQVLEVAFTVAGPLALSVADARVEEGDGAVLDFVVTLDRAATETVTVDYATADGTATEPDDYGEESGALTFAAGVTERTVSVTVEDDTHHEGEETMTLTLSNPNGAALADAEATGTIANSDPMPQAWLARFGRTVAGHVVDAIGERAAGPAGGRSRVTLGGQRLALDGARPGDGGTPDGSPGGAPSMTGRELLLGSSFVLGLSGEGEEAPATRWTAWGGAAASRFDGEADGLALDGEVTTFTLGADAARDGWLAGLALALSEGEGGFRDHADTGDPAHEHRGEGEVASTLTSVHPYLRFEASERLTLWGLLGYGAGELDLALDDGERWTTDTSIAMAAAGARGVLVAPGSAGGLALRLRGDAVMQRMRSDAARSGRGGNLAAARARTSRLRLVLEGSHRSAPGAGGALTPSFEAGLRHDGGDAETGVGLELGGGLRYADPASGLTAEAKVRALLAHEDPEYREWGASGSVRLDPGASGRGLSLRLAPAWGPAAGGGAERLWSLPDVRGLGHRDAPEPSVRLDAEAGYGLPALATRGVATPYTGLALAPEGERTWRSGLRWTLGPAASLGLEATRRESPAAGPPAHALTFRATLRW